MYNIIVVEDETIIRRGIIKSIHWEKLGYTVVGEANNGKEAVKIIEKNKTDVVITDIRMERMDGIELAKYICKNHPQIKVVILTGYEDVEYLKEAIKSNVVDYLLKPTGAEQITEVLNKIKSILDNENKKRNELKEIKNRLNQNIEYAREKIIKQLINGHFEDEQQILRQIKENNINLKKPFYVTIIDIDKFYSIKNLYSNNEMNKILRKIVKISNKVYGSGKYGKFILNNEDEVVGICCNSNKLKNNKTADFFRKIQLKVYNQLKVTVSISVGNECDSISKIKLSYEEAKKALKQKVFLGRENIIKFNKINKSKSINIDKCHFDVDKIINIIFYNSKESYVQYVDKVLNQFENKVAYNPDIINYMCLELLFAIARQARQMNLPMEKLLLDTGLNFEQIYEVDSIEDKKEWLIKVLNHIKCFNQKTHNSNSHDLIKKIIDYVNKNYTRNDISLNLISSVVHKNAAYISKLFKEKTGQNFIEYVTKLRVKKAMMLLQQDKLKIYEISTEVGYADVSHFTRTFKKHTGISPLEYRETSGREIV